MADVPCNGCVRCCVSDAPRILDDEDAPKYLTTARAGYPGKFTLARAPSGACIYLGLTGCLIHDNKPKLCRDFDCRTLARQISFTSAKKIGIIPIFEKGRELAREKP